MIILAAISTVKMLKVLTFTSMVLTFSIPQIKKFGIMSTNLLNLITISTHQLLTTRAVFITFHLTWIHFMLCGALRLLKKLRTRLLSKRLIWKMLSLKTWKNKLSSWLDQISTKSWSRDTLKNNGDVLPQTCLLSSSSVFRFVWLLITTTLMTVTKEFRSVVTMSSLKICLEMLK